jgi:putative DNA primase/helicase
MRTLTVTEKVDADRARTAGEQLQVNGAGKQKDASDHIAVARAVRTTIGPEDVLFHQHAFWRFRERGVWAKIEDREIQLAIHGELDQGTVKFSRSTVDSVMDLLRTECYRPEHQFNAGGELINTPSGTITWSADLKSWEQRQHCREDYLTVQIPVAYDPAARCPRFLDFLHQVFAGDKDAADKALVVMEMVGYSLLTSCRFEKFILLIGGGANGKTVLLKVVESLIGSAMVCAVQPSQLDNKFQRAHLAGKLVNLVTEIAEGAEIADAQLKAIVSGELTTAEHKHRPPFDFHPFATCWFATNHMPHSRDFSDAMFRRAIVITFNNKFEGANCDPNLIDKLKIELPGILTLALCAIRGVILRGTFTEVASSITAKREWQLNCDQAAQYFEERLQTVSGGKVGSTVLYQDYRDWATEQGLNRILTQKTLIQRLATRYGVAICRDMSHRYIGGAEFKSNVSHNVVDIRDREGRS